MTKEKEEQQQTNAVNELVTDTFQNMVNVYQVRKNLTQMMLRDVHQNSGDYSTEDVEDFAITLHYLEDIE